MGMMLVYLVLFIAPLIIGVCLGVIWEWREAKGIREDALREAANIVEVLKGVYEEGGSPTAGRILGVAIEDILALIGENK